jgi:Restriction endonuclease
MTMEPKWKRFERLAYEIQKELAGDAEIKFDDSIVGVDSKVPRQIDISIRKHVGQYAILIVIDCKDYAEPLDVKDVETFSALVRDVRANRGAMIVSSSFTPAALNIAKNEGIDTYRLVDTENVDWKTYAVLPCLLERTYLKRFAFRFSSVPFKGFEIPSSVKEMMTVPFCAPDGTPVGTLSEMLRGKWDKAEMPRSAGEHTVLLGDDLVHTHYGRESHSKIVAITQVTTEYYFGPLPVKLRGLQDFQTGGVITRTLTTDAIEPAKIERGEDPNWKRIDDLAQLAVVKPAIRLAYFDVYSEDAVS